jgi:protein phosphatase
LTHVGRVRERNEDCFAALPHLGALLVADGVGGHRDGDLASRMTIDIVRELIEEPDATWPAGHAPTAQQRGPEILVAGVNLANSRIHTISARQSSKRGMATTFVGALLHGEYITIAHVGDSRAYRLRGRQFDQLTDDHSFVSERVRAGAMTPEEAVSSPLRNMITRCVGTAADVNVDTRVERAQLEDVYLLCTDGLCGVVELWELAAILLSHDDLRDVAGRMIERANDLGGPDNITVVLARVVDLSR